MLTTLQAHVARARLAVKRGVAWALWSRRNAVITVAGLVAVFMVLFIVASTSTVVDISNAIPKKAPTTSSDALKDYTTKPRTPSELATGEVGKLTPKPGTRPADNIDATAGKFMTLWLAGHGKTEAERAGWVATMEPYVTYAMRDTLAETDMATVPDATVITSQTANLLDSATTTFTLSTGRIVAVQTMHNAGSWMVRGLATGTP